MKSFSYTHEKVVVSFGKQCKVHRNPRPNNNIIIKYASAKICDVLFSQKSIFLIIIVYRLNGFRFNMLISAVSYTRHDDSILTVIVTLYIYTTGVGNLRYLNVQFMVLRKMHQYLDNGMFIFLSWPLFNHGRFCNFLQKNGSFLRRSGRLLLYSVSARFFFATIWLWTLLRNGATGVFGNR